MSGNGRFRNDGYSRSSFARSFFEAGTSDLDEGNGALDDETTPGSSAVGTISAISAAAAVPVPQSRPPRPLARRASSRGAGLLRATSVGAATPGVAAAAAAAAAATMNDYNNGMGHAGHSSVPTTLSPEVDRSASWYTDAKTAGFTSENLNEFLDAPHNHQETPAAAAPDSSFGEEEVLEQYRIMAQHDALLRVKENTGFDAEEYERRHKLKPPERTTNKKSLYGGGKKPQVRLPPLKKIIPLNISLKLEEPPMPPPRVNNFFLQQAGLRVPELCTGMSVRGTASVGKDEHLVRCLGCRNQLRVKLLATLVSCPDCNTVSPASSTRR